MPISSSTRTCAEASNEELAADVKRAIDIAGARLVDCAYRSLAAIALIIKLTSKGPVLFEQERLGKFGGRFKCLKFRTMYLNCAARFAEYVQRFIAGKAETAPDERLERGRLQNHERPARDAGGTILRKTSLDELPQLWNVLRGEMSLVGPRPPVPYEFEVYDVWHRRRVLEVKPGITGLWQVSGRSRTRFDDMVRLDLSIAGLGRCGWI